MGSLIGKALAPRNAAPVALGESGIRVLPGSSGGANLDLALIRAYKTNGTVRANVGLIAEAVAAQDWNLFRAQPKDGRVRYTTNDQGSDQRTQVVQHAALNLLNNPASITVNGIRLPVWTRKTLIKISEVWLHLTGKSYWIVDYGTAGGTVPIGLWPVRPDRMTPVPSRDNYLAGYLYTSPDGTERIPLLPTEVIFARSPDPEDVYGGCGPIESVLTDVQAAGYAAEWNRNYFVNSAEPGGVIQLDHELQEDEFDQLVDRWRETHRGVARAHRIAVLENGATWIPNAHSMRDMDFANLRGTSRDIIREALAMHKVMTGVTEDVNRANAQTGEEVFASWKVDPRLQDWRDVFNLQLLPLFGPTGQGVEFDYSYPTPVNREQDALELTSKSAAAQVLVDSGYDPGDVLEVVGLPAMKVVEKATQQPALPPAWVPAPPAAPPGGDAAAGPAARYRRVDPWAALEVLERQRGAWNRLAGVS
jgi:hypothetical protein